MDLFATVLSATAAIELLAAVLFALAFSRRSVDREYAVATFLATAAAVHAVGTLVSERTGALAVVLVAGRAASVGLIAAIASAAHFGLVYRGARASRVTVVA